MHKSSLWCIVVEIVAVEEETIFDDSDISRGVKSLK